MAAILSGALANIGSYGLLRFGGGILPRELALGTAAVLVLGSASIVYGALQAVSRRNTSEVLAYSAIGQAGYILVALGVGGTVGFSAAVIYAVVNSLNKALLFLAAGLRGPLVGAAFAVGAFSVAGVPPAAGSSARSRCSRRPRGGPAGQGVALVALIFAGSALSFLYMFQVYQRLFLAPRRGHGEKPSRCAARCSSSSGGAWCCRALARTAALLSEPAAELPGWGSRVTR